MTLTRKVAFAFITVVLVGIAGLVTVIVVGPPGPSFVCHRLLNGALAQWMLDTTNGVDTAMPEDGVSAGKPYPPNNSKSG
jgi:hypothetical protein